LTTAFLFFFFKLTLSSLCKLQERDCEKGDVMSMLSTCSVYRCTFLYKVTLPSTGLAWMQLFFTEPS